MNPENPTRKVSWYEWIGLGAFVLLLLALAVPTKHHGESGPLCRLTNNAKMLIISVQIYADEHEGKYPHSLVDLVKGKVLEGQSMLDKLLSHPLEKPQTPLGWIYLPDLSDKTALHYPIFISPILQDDSGPIMQQLKTFVGYRPPFTMKPSRVVAFNDSSVEVLRGVEFQKTLQYHGITLSAVEALNNP